MERVLKRGLRGDQLVRQLQQRLNELGFGPLSVTGNFLDGTEQAVRHFQGSVTDLDGQPLKIDGRVGPITWAALFGPSPEAAPGPVPSGSPLLDLVLSVAGVEADAEIREDPPGSNSGPRVDEYLAAVGLGPGFSWCAAFVYWCFVQAAQQLGVRNPCIKTAGVVKHWRLAQQRGVAVVTRARAASNPGLVRPGLIFLLQSNDKGQGHTGLVAGLQDGKLETIEGNTSPGGSREGGGVYRRNSRRIADINLGFIDYGEA